LALGLGQAASLGQHLSQRLGGLGWGNHFQPHHFIQHPQGAVHANSLLGSYLPQAPVTCEEHGLQRPRQNQGELAVWIMQLGDDHIRGYQSKGESQSLS
jgi:hypothetical protein